MTWPQVMAGVGATVSWIGALWWIAVAAIGIVWLVGGPECGQGGRCDRVDWLLLTLGGELCTFAGAALAIASGLALTRYARGEEGRSWTPLAFAGMGLLLGPWFFMWLGALAASGSFS